MWEELSWTLELIYLDLYWNGIQIPFLEGVPSALWETYVLNPLADIDLTAMTDGEDLMAFASDVFEFFEQDKAMLIDSITDLVIKNPQAATFTAFLAARVLGPRFFKK